MSLKQINRAAIFFIVFNIISGPAFVADAGHSGVKITLRAGKLDASKFLFTPIEKSPSLISDVNGYPLIHLGFTGEKDAQAMDHHVVVLLDGSSKHHYLDWDNRFIRSHWGDGTRYTDNYYMDYFNYAKRQIQSQLETYAHIGKGSIVFSFILFSGNGYGGDASKLLIDREPVTKDNVEQLKYWVSITKSDGYSEEIAHGLSQGVKQLDKPLSDSSKPYAKSLIMFTEAIGGNDALLQHIQSSGNFEKLTSGNYDVHLIGLRIPPSPFLESLAQILNAQYFHIKDTRNDQSKNEKFWHSLAKKITTTVAANIKVKMTLPQGVGIKKILPIGLNKKHIAEQNIVEFSLGSIAREQTKNFYAIVDRETTEDIVVELGHGNNYIPITPPQSVNFAKIITLDDLGESNLADELCNELLTTIANLTENLAEFLGIIRPLLAYQGLTTTFKLALHNMVKEMESKSEITANNQPTSAPNDETNLTARMRNLALNQDTHGQGASQKFEAWDEVLKNIPKPKDEEKN